MERRNWRSWIWAAGCAVWLMDGLVNLRHPNKQQAALAFVLAALFAIAGAFFRQQER